jgi:hypothetical protein
MPFYALMGVSWSSLVDPRDQTLQVSELVDAHWVIRVVCSNEEALRLPPSKPSSCRYAGDGP